MIGDNAIKKLDKENIYKAAMFLREKFGEMDKKDEADFIKAVVDDPVSWYTPVHFGWGMSIRNLLRKNEFGEDDLGVKNLDDVYVALAQFAIMTLDMEESDCINLAQTILIGTVAKCVESAELFYTLQELERGQ